MAQQATLINDAGKKVVVESGSQQAQQYFGQGYKLMGASPAPAPAIVAAAPKGSVVIPTAADIPNYKVTGQFGKTGAPGSGLYGIPNTPPAVTPPPTAPINNVNDANAHINSDQKSDFDTASKTDDPAIRSSVQGYKDIYDSLTKSLTSNLPTKVETPNLTQKYSDLRTQQGVSELETSLADLNKQARDIQAISRQRTAAELDKPVAMNVIAGRVTEEERQDNERLQAVNSSIQQVTQQLQSKYSVIDSLMKYADMDYDNATNSYDKQFAQNLQVFNTVKGVIDTETTQAEKKTDDARANLQIIYNNFKTNNIDPTKIDDAQKTNITKLELQAGLPQGFYESVVDKNPKAEIVSTTTREDNDKKYVDLILRNADGSLKVSTQYIGPSRTLKTGGSGSGAPKMTEAEKKKAAISKMAGDLNAITGGDGYVSPQDYKQGRRLWIQAGNDGGSYDTTFKSYVNPTQYTEVGLSLDQTRYNNATE